MVVTVIIYPAWHNSKDSHDLAVHVDGTPWCCNARLAQLYVADPDRLSKQQFSGTFNGWDGFKYDFILSKEKWRIIWIKLIHSSCYKKALHHFLSIYSEGRFESCKESHTSNRCSTCSAMSSSIFYTLIFWGLELVGDKARRLGLSGITKSESQLQKQGLKTYSFSFEIQSTAERFYQGLSIWTSLPLHHLLGTSNESKKSTVLTRAATNLRTQLANSLLLQIRKETSG